MNVALDFDGVLHHDQGPWRGVSHIPGPAVEGALEFVRELWRAGHEVVVYTCRALEPAGAEAVRAWLTARLGEPAPDVVGTKPIAHLYIDDRGFRFEGSFPSMVEVDRLCHRTWIRGHDPAAVE